MSVSALDRSVSASSATDTAPLNPKPDAKASRHAPATLSFTSQSAVNVNFNSSANQAGPTFDGNQRPSECHTHHPHFAFQPNKPPMSSPAVQQGFMQQLQQLINQWFGGQRPPAHNPCNNAPPRPHPPGAGRPTPDYSTKSNEQLGQALLDNFKAFTGSSQSKTMHTSAIAAMARRALGSDPAMNQNIQLAKELMRRPDVLAAFDRNAGTGVKDGWVDKQQLGALIRDDNFFKYKNDKEVAGEMLNHFDALKSRFSRGEIDVRGLRKLASEPLTGNSQRDHLVQLAQTVLKRSELLTKMDNLASEDADGRISKQALEQLSR